MLDALVERGHQPLAGSAVKLLLALSAALACALCALGLIAVLLGASAAGGACSTGTAASAFGPGGSWTATAYGPPWGGIQGDGITATGLDLRSGPQLLEVAVDPSLIPLGSWVYVQPNPFGTTQPFYAADTGGAIVGRRVDVYDWRGRASQEAWGQRSVSVALAAAPTTPEGCAATGGSVQMVAGSRARILADGSAAAPSNAPLAVKLAIAAGNSIHTRPYPAPDVHYGSLAHLWPAYDCSGAVSFVLYKAGLLGPRALDSSELETYGEPGPGRWITVYANPAHTWIAVAGIALDTAEYGGSSVPAGSGPRWRAQQLANLGDGSAYVVRHRAGM